MEKETLKMPAENRNDIIQSEEENDDVVYVKEYEFSDETLKSLSELGCILRKIHERLASEGYSMIDGQVKKMDTIEY